MNSESLHAKRDLPFTLIICTYKRPVPVVTLLDSVARQTLYPDEILVVDGSPDDATAAALQSRSFANLTYYKVPNSDRGLTRQRNYGIARTGDTQIIAFLDDDIVLEPDYFEKLIETYREFPDALGVGGYIVEDVGWEPLDDKYADQNFFVFDGWKRRDGSRFVIRKKLGLDSDVPPGFMPLFSHGRSIGFLPPSGKTYRVEQLMGGVSSFRKNVFQTFSFSHYFEGYGLYEDADFCLRLAQSGPLYLNTSARLYHYHDDSGRPNRFDYGQMVVRNGWYVWRVRHPKPGLKAAFKWHAITLLLAGLRLLNTFNANQKKRAFTEAMGRFWGWLRLFFDKPSLHSSK